MTLLFTNFLAKFRHAVHLAFRCVLVRLVGGVKATLFVFGSRVGDDDFETSMPMIRLKLMHCC